MNYTKVFSGISFVNGLPIMYGLSTVVVGHIWRHEEFGDGF